MKKDDAFPTLENNFLDDEDDDVSDNEEPEAKE